MTRVLLIAPQWIGDAVMAQPLVALLAARGEQVTALGPTAVAPVLRLMPGIVEVVEAPFVHGKVDFGARRRIAAQLRGQGFERAYILGNNVKSRLVPWMARIPQRIGYRGEARGLLLTHAVNAPDSAPPAEPLAISPIACRLQGETASAVPASVSRPNPDRADMRRHYAALAEIVQSDDAAPPRHASLTEPTLRVAADVADAARRRFGLPRRWIALCPGAEYGPAKQWPVEHYAALARFAQREGYAVAVLGAPRDTPAGDAIAARAPGTLGLCGKTRLHDAIVLLASASGAVSNDSGLMHVAAALGRPTVGLYGSTDPRHTPPAAHRSATIWLQLDCSPCFRRTCPLGHLNCLRHIAPEQAWAQLQRLIDGDPAP